MLTAAAYIRVSTDDQVEYSPDSQLKALRSYAQAHNMTLPEEYIYIDEGITGKSVSKRIAFNKMISAAKTKPKPFDVILVWKFSRFARNRQDSIVYKSMLRKDLGIDVISITENLGDDKISILIEALIEAMDEYYSINLGQEVMRGLNEKFVRGEPVANPPFGYDIVDKKYIINELQAAVVRDIYSKFVNGVPIQRIVQSINDLGIKTNRGNIFLHRNIIYILRNPVYAGKLRFASKGRIKDDYYNEYSDVVDGKHEPIISNEIWERAQFLLNENRKLYPHKHKKYNKTEYMLRGIIRCSNCGSTLCRVGDKYLQCHLYQKGGCNESHHISMKVLEKNILNAVENQLLNLSFDFVQKPIVDNQDIQIQRLEAQLERAKKAYINGIDSLAEYKSNKTSIMDQLNKLKKPCAPITKQEYAADKIHLIAVLRDENTPPDAKNRILRSFIKNIIYDKKNNSLKIFFY